MAIELISKIKPKSDFNIVDSNDIEWEMSTYIPLSNVIDSSDNVPLLDKIGKNTIPILDENARKAIEEKGQKVPDDYIDIPNADSQVTAFSGDDEQGNRYLDIVFSAIRSLQAEIAKLRNTMNYGMYSYTDEKTAMAAVVDSYKINDSEPLWAIDEDDLALLTEGTVQMNSMHTLVPKQNVEAGDGILSVLPGLSASWIDDSSKAECIKNQIDAKLFLFLTAKTMNTTLSFTNLDDSGRKFSLDLNTLGVTPVFQEKYNILVSVSRSFKGKADTEYYGKNFIWVSIVSYDTLNKKVEGYWNPLNGGLYHDVQEISSSQYPERSKNRFYIDRVDFKDPQSIYKFNMYSKYQDFSTEVQPNTPDDSQYKYEVAHITIRSVKTEEVLKSIILQLPKNELIYNQENNSLYIVSETGKYKRISGGSGGGDEGMTKQEIITWLTANGIHVTEDGGQPLWIDNLNLGDITFINQDTGKSFKFTCSPEGKLESREVLSVSLEDRLSACNYYDDSTFRNTAYRGFAGTLGLYELKKSNPDAGVVKVQTRDAGLYSDRIKIGAIYAPEKTQDVYGCSHAFVELENTSSADFQLKGCYLHYAVANDDSSPINEYVLPLDGVIPSGGTYLVRGKKYADKDDANCYIDVATYDKEWYITNSLGHRELVDFSLYGLNSWLLSYGHPENINMIQMSYPNDDQNKDKIPYKRHADLIDTVSIKAPITQSKSQTWNYSMKTWFNNKNVCSVDCIYKNTFELDPAKQAFQALTTCDSSRERNSSASDYQYVLLNKDIIEFPKTSDVRKVNLYTPKASFEHKNVMTDKTKLNAQKPNMVTCSFGIDIRKTRCFNWISTGVFDEYVWIRQKGQTEWQSRFESYNNMRINGENDQPGGMNKKYFGDYDRVIDESGATEKDRVENIIYNRIIGSFPGSGIKYTSHKCVIDIVQSYVSSPTEYEYIVGRADKNMNPDIEHISDIQTFTLYPQSYVPRIFQITDQQGFHWIEYQVWAAAAIQLNNTINEIKSVSNIIPILINTGDMTQNGTRINEWLDYYNAGKPLFDHLEQMNVVGNNDLCGSDPETLGTGDDYGKSNAFYFHVFYCYEIDTDNIPIISNYRSTKYVPSLYYFDAIGTTPADTYRFIMVNSEITEENCKSWFKQLNNDQSDNVINVYTGWPISQEYGKIYDRSFTTIYTMIYRMMNNCNGHIIVACHEMPFTVVTNSNLNSAVAGIDRSLDKGSTGNLVGSHLNRINNKDNYSNYWFSRLLEKFNVKLCIGGHKHTYACTNKLNELYYYQDVDGNLSCSYFKKMEMGETLSSDSVIHNFTADRLYTQNDGAANYEYYTLFTVDRGEIQSLPTTVEKFNEGGPDGKQWNNADVVKDNSRGGAYYILHIKNSPVHEDDDFEWNVRFQKEINTSKYPLMYNTEYSGIRMEVTNNIMNPCYCVNDSDHNDDGVTYFMLQATGYKLKSNKELPSPNQTFSYVIPKTKIGESETPSDDQQRPMFAEIVLMNNKQTIYLYRIENIMNDKTHVFSQLDYGKDPCKYKYLKKTDIYGEWVEGEKQILITLPN